MSVDAKNSAHLASQDSLLSGSGLITHFGEARSGTVAIIFALSIMIMIAVVGGAVDYGRWHNAKTKQQHAIDTAALAAGRVSQTSGGNATAVIEAAHNYYQQIKSTDLVAETTTFELVDSGKAVRGISEARVATPFLTFVGYPELPINVGARVILANGANSDERIEVSMMLDITGSMSGQKIEDLKLAAKDLVNIVVDATDPDYARVALAPFSEHVNVGQEFFEKVTNIEPPNATVANTCVRERDGAERYTEEQPRPGMFFTPGPDTGWCRPGTTIMPLSGDKTALTAHIDTFAAQGMTAGHLGTAWAWYMLSPKWSGVWPSQSHAKPYGDPKVKKIAVLMTDGDYNQQYSGDSAAIQARAICTNMKAAGITVYSVVFQMAEGSEAEATMQHCATSPSHFFNSTTGEELRQAFREIALQITTLRISK